MPAPHTADKPLELRMFESELHAPPPSNPRPPEHWTRLTALPWIARPGQILWPAQPVQTTGEHDTGPASAFSYPLRLTAHPEGPWLIEIEDAALEPWLDTRAWPTREGVAQAVAQSATRVVAPRVGRQWRHNRPEDDLTWTTPISGPQDLITWAHAATRLKRAARPLRALAGVRAHHALKHLGQALDEHDRATLAEAWRLFHEVGPLDRESARLLFARTREGAWLRERMRRHPSAWRLAGARPVDPQADADTTTPARDATHANHQLTQAVVGGAPDHETLRLIARAARLPAHAHDHDVARMCARSRRDWTILGPRNRTGAAPLSAVREIAREALNECEGAVLDDPWSTIVIVAASHQIRVWRQRQRTGGREAGNAGRRATRPPEQPLDKSDRKARDALARHARLRATHALNDPDVEPVEALAPDRRRHGPRLRPTHRRTSLTALALLAKLHTGDRDLYAGLERAIDGERPRAWEVEWEEEPDPFVERGTRGPDGPTHAHRCWQTLMRVDDAALPGPARAWGVVERYEHQVAGEIGQVIARAITATMDTVCWTPLLGAQTLGTVEARPLASATALIAEGDRMRHCVGGQHGRWTSIRPMTHFYHLEHHGAASTLAVWRDPITREWGSEHDSVGNQRPDSVLRKAARTLTAKLRRAETALTEVQRGVFADERTEARRRFAHGRPDTRAAEQTVLLARWPILQPWLTRARPAPAKGNEGENDVT